jgi:phospholipase/carboxylesterase
MLNGPSFVPNDVQKALILFHGYGADGEDLFSLTPFLKKIFPHMAFFMPNAPQVTFGGGYEWFSLDDYFQKPCLDEDYLSILSQRAKEKLPLIQEYIQDIQKKTNLLEKDIFIGGFSQGGLMAAQTAFAANNSYAGLILMSPVPPFDIPQNAKKIPVLITRGEQDTVIPKMAAQRTKPLFKENNFNPIEIIDEYAPHSITDKHLEGIIQFINSNLS